VLGMLILSALIGIMEAVTHIRVLPYDLNELQFRPIGLANHPLALGSLCATAIGFVVLARWPVWMRLLAVFILFVGCAASGAREIRYRHGDAVHLGSLLSQYQGDERPKFILTESVFSMEGDVAPLAEIGRLAREHDAMLIVDDAHATGILGEGGRGLSEEADVVIGTFSKALGSFGAYVACSGTFREYLINRCAGLIYSTTLPPPVLGAIDAALDLLPSLDAERAHVASLAKRFRQGARSLGYDTGASITQIVPLIAGSNHAALSLSKRLREAGFFATAIRPPTVPAGTARLRLAFTAAHSTADLDGLLEALDDRALPRSATA